MTLSIITINYNNREGLQKTIDSVLAQTWTDYEWIVIDGGSSDGSRELIGQYQEHFAYWCSEPDRGVYHAMNKGIARAKGEYINFMNSGDIFYSEGTLYAVFSKGKQADILYGDWIDKYTNESVMRKIPLSELHSTMWYQNICHQAMFIKTNLLQGVGYDESMKILADWLWNTDKMLAGISFEHIDVTICNYDMYGMSNEGMNDIKSQEYQRVMTLYPFYMQRAIRELDNYKNDRYIQITRELNESKGILSIMTKCSLECLFIIKLIIKRIIRICDLKS